MTNAAAGALTPAIVQDADTRQVLMLGYMNEAALAATKACGEVTFFSRSKGRLWRKGETSGNVLRLVDVRRDCDADALLVLARPCGPTCHAGTISCFGDAPEGLETLGMLWRTIEARAAAPDATPSYTRKLLAAGVPRQAQKVGEEGVEVALAAALGDDRALAEEAADLLYHLLVVLKGRGLTPAAIMDVLARRAAGARQDA